MFYNFNYLLCKDGLMNRLKRAAEIVAAAVLLVVAGCFVLMAGMLQSMNDRIAGEDYLQPYDRPEFALAVAFIVIAISVVILAVIMMEMPKRRRGDVRDTGDETQSRGAVLQVAFDGEDFASHSQK